MLFSYLYLNYKHLIEGESFLAWILFKKGM